MIRAVGRRTLVATLIQAENVSFAYPPPSPEQDPTPAIENASLNVESGELVALIGQNGSGKSTLARMLNGLLKPDEGRVYVNGLDTSERDAGEIARSVGYVFQNPDHALFLPTIREEVSYGLQRQGVSGDELDERVHATLEQFGLLDLIDEHPASLPRGVRRLIVVAAVDAIQPDVLVLDEPTSGLDQRLTEHLMCRLGEIIDGGRSVILISHDMRLVAEHCPRSVLLHEGRVAWDGATEELFHNLSLMESVGISPPHIASLAHDLRGQLGESHAITVADMMELLRAKRGRT